MEKPQTIIQPPARLSVGFKELWQYRELFYFFTWRDIKVKYKQTYLGVAWALLQPLALMLIFSFVFKRFDAGTYQMQYEVFVLSGIIFWNLFQNAVSNASESIIAQGSVIKKIYFPRLLIPCSALLVALFDFVMAFIIFLLFCLFYKQPVSANAMVYFPLALLVVFITAFGLGTLLSALNIKYRDFRYVIPFLLQLLFFATQVIYSLHGLNNDVLVYVLALNPVNAALELFRYPFTGIYNAQVVYIGLCATLLIAVSGLLFFRKTESYFADLA